MRCWRRSDSEAKQVPFQIRLKDKGMIDYYYSFFKNFIFSPTISSTTEGFNLSLLGFLVETPTINLTGK